MPLLAARRHSNTPARSGSSTSSGEFIFFSNLLYRGQLLAQESKSNHPDVNAGSPTAELQFRQIVAAYELLKDPLQREAYDQQLKGDRRARARRIASPLISGVVSGGLVALTMWWFNTHKPPEP